VALPKQEWRVALDVRRVALMAVVCSVPCAVVVAQTPDTAAVKIRLEDAIGAAQRNSPQAIQAHGQISTAATEERASYAAFLPNVSVGVNSSFANQGGTRSGGSVLTGANGSPIVTGSGGTSASYRSTGTVTASMTVLDWGQRVFNLRAARADIAAAEAASTAQTYNIAYSVTQAFYAALAAREALAAAQVQLALADSTQRIANLMVRARTAILSDSLRAAIQASTARVAIATALNNLSSANANLSRLTASTVMVTADPADSGVVFTPLPDTTTLQRLAATGPTVQQATATQRASIEQQHAARAAFLPQLDANYSFTGNGQNAYLGLGDPYTYGNRFSLSLSLPILDQFQREAALERAQIAASNAGASTRDARLAARQSLSQALGALQLARNRITEQTASIRAAEEDLRVQLDRYRLHEATIVDVLTSQNELTQAQSGLIQARYDYRIARAQIEAIIGRPL
jgi:outer membrane protein